jgi:sugar phosphate isomerase/epimerase
MRLSISTWCYHYLDREEAFARIADFGVEGIEIVTHAPASHIDEDATDEHVTYVKGLLTKYALAISAISPYTEFLQFEPKGMEAEIQHVHRVVDLCVKIGADHLRLFAGGRIPENRTQEECLDAVVYGLKESAQYAEQRGVRLSVENHGQFGRTFGLFKQVMDEVPNVGVTLHTAGIDQISQNYLDMVAYFAPRIVHTHLNDRVTVGDALEMRALGNGLLDFPAIFEILRDVEYDGYYNLEFGPSVFCEDPTSLIEESLAYLRKSLS